MRAAALAAAALLVSLPVRARQPELPDRLLAELNRTRAERGLGALTADPALAAVAQARVDAMAREGWFALASPDGRRVEDDLDAARYAFRLCGEKLLRSVLDPEELAAAWTKEPEKQAESLFLSGVTRVGIGVADDGGIRLIDIVLVEPAAAGTAPGRASVSVDDPAAAVAALEELIAQRRKAAGLADLRPDPRLAQAAQQRAESLRAALEQDQRPESVGPLDESGGELVSILVVDAATAGLALTTLEGSQQRAEYLDPAWRRIGIGLSAGPPGAGRRIAWVVALRAD